MCKVRAQQKAAFRHGQWELTSEGKTGLDWGRSRMGSHESLLGSWNHQVLNNGRQAFTVSMGLKRDEKPQKPKVASAICDTEGKRQNLVSHCRMGMKREAGQRRLREGGVWQRKGQVGGRTQEWMLGQVYL